MASRFGLIAGNLHRHPKVRRGGRAAREVFVFAICCNADEHGQGRVDASYFAPDHLADALDMPAHEAESGLRRAVEVGLLELDGDEVVIVGWGPEWGGAKSGAERTRKWRESKSVTSSDAPPSHDVTAVTRDACDADQKRSEEIRSEEIRDPPLIPPSGDVTATARVRAGKAKAARAARKRPLPGDWEPSDKQRELADSQGLVLATEAERFRLWALAKGQLYLDWDKAFSSWLLNANRFSRGQVPARSPPPRDRAQEIWDMAQQMGEKKTGGDR